MNEAYSRALPTMQALFGVHHEHKTMLSGSLDGRFPEDSQVLDTQMRSGYWHLLTGWRPATVCATGHLTLRLTAMA